MLNHFASEGLANLQWGSNFIQKTPGVRQTIPVFRSECHYLWIMSFLAITLFVPQEPPVVEEYWSKWQKSSMAPRGRSRALG